MRGAELPLRLALAGLMAAVFGCELIASRGELGERFPLKPTPDAASGDPLDADVGDSGAPDSSAEVDSGAVRECATNRECVDKLGQFHLCRYTDGTCVSMLSQHCSEVIGDYQNDDAFLLGSIGPTSGSSASTGHSNLWGIKLAVKDFATLGNGLPPAESGGRRPLVVVHCDDAGNADQAVSGAQHLVSNVGVSAIIGPSFSGITLQVASKVTVPAGVLTVSPAATSASITHAVDGGLLWRTAPSDVVQAAAQSLLIPRVGELIRQNQRLMAGYPLKLMLLHKGDAYGIGLAEGVARRLIWNEDDSLEDSSNPFVMRFDYGDPGNPDSAPPAYEQAVAKVLDLEPHVVVLYGTGEVTELVSMIESAWPSDALLPPHYVFADGAHTSELARTIAELDPIGEHQLADRVFGTEPGFLGANYRLFEQLYTSTTGAPEVPITFGSANAYDATYVLAYASVVAGYRHPTGIDLAMAIARLVPSEGRPQVDVGAARIPEVFQKLSGGESIDLNGASGPLDFDLQTGDVASGILLWCAQVDAHGGVKLVPTLESYNPATGEIEYLAEETARCGQHQGEEF